MRKYDGRDGVEKSLSSSMDSGCDQSSFTVRRSVSRDSTASRDSGFSSVRSSRVSADLGHVSSNGIKMKAYGNF